MPPVYLRRLGAGLLSCLLGASFAFSEEGGSCEPQAEAVSFTTVEGFTLRGEVLSPCGSKADQPLPAVLFINPFGQSFFAYKAQATTFAAAGYRTMSYDPRGWQTSEGATTLDYTVLTADARRSLDWLTSHYKTTRIGATGISEGGGLSLLLSAEEPRLSAVASLSGWTDLNHPSMGHTPRLAWSAILSTMAVLFGDPTALIEEAIRQAQGGTPGQDLPRTQEEQMRRISAVYRINDINARKTPILLTHNLDDTLFPLNQVIDFYQQLKGPKHLEINRGFHANSEILGLAGAAVAPWTTLRLWFDDYLKGDHGSALDGRLVFAFKNRPEVLELRNDEWREPKVTNFYLRAAAQGGELTKTAAASESGVSLLVVNASWDPSGVTTGVPLLSALANQQSLATVTEPVANLPQPYAIAFSAPAENLDQTVYGISRLKLHLRSEAEHGLVIAHLVDVDASGEGHLITHGVYTWQPADRLADGRIEVKLELYSTAWRLDRGHHLALVLNGQDAEYMAPSPFPYSYELDGEAGQLSLAVPLTASK